MPRISSLRIAGLALAAIWAAVALVGCSPSTYHHCQSDQDCVDPGRVEPRCESTGSCSYFSEDCDSDRQYGDRADPALAGTCVAEPDAGVTDVDATDAETIDGAVGPLTCVGDSSARNVCIPGACIAAGAGPCTDAVCEIDASCCLTEWTERCVALASATCPEVDCERVVAIGSYAALVVARPHDDTWTSVWTHTADNNLADARQLEMAWADHDGDGDLDLALASECLITIDTNNGVASALQWGPRFELAPPDADPADGCAGYDGRFQGRDVAWGDVDRDGDLELAVAGNWGLLVLSAGDGTWTPQYLEPAGGVAVGANDVLWVDVDQDGWLDLVVGYAARPAALYHNDHGDLERVAWQGPISTNDIVGCNLDGDPEPELAIATGQLTVVDNGGGTLTALAANGSALAVRCADIDGDGGNELITLDDDGDHVRIWNVDPVTLALDEAWTSPQTFRMSFDRGAGLDVADWDGDGDLDLVAIDNHELVVPPAPWFRVLENTGGAADFVAVPGQYLGDPEANPPWSLSASFVSLDKPATR